MKRSTKTTIRRDESKLFFAACSCLVVSACVYMYFVSASVLHVVMRKEIDSQIAELSSAISQQDAEYIEMQHSVSSDIATMKGFAIATKKVFIDKSDTSLVVLRN